MDIAKMQRQRQPQQAGAMRTQSISACVVSKGMGRWSGHWASSQVATRFQSRAELLLASSCFYSVLNPGCKEIGDKLKCNDEFFQSQRKLCLSSSCIWATSIFNWELVQDAPSSNRDDCCATQSSVVSLQYLGYIMRGLSMFTWILF